MFDPADFRSVATRCIACSDEAARRTAIGRSYYSVYMQLAVYVKTWSSPPSTGGAKSHIKTIDALKRIGVQDTQSVRSRLAALKTLRTHADYDATYQNAEADSKRALRMATKIANQLSALEQDHPDPQP